MAWIWCFRQASRKGKLEDTEMLVETDKGREIIYKLNGLKRFIKDFGNFDKKDLEEIHLWDEYILYAIILNESNSLEKEALKEFNDIQKIISKLYKGRN